MAENNFGKGIKITSGFDLSAKLPLDNRSIVNTIEERDEHVENNRAYEGMKVYVLSEKKEYRYNGTDWEDLINATNGDASIKEVELSEIEPTDENISIWINTAEDISIDVVPKINDKIIASDTTWSSEKINASIINGGSGGSSDIDLTSYALKSEVPTKVSQLDNDKNYLTKIPSEYITEQELAQTNSSVQKLNEKYDGLSIRYDELSSVVENLNDNEDTIATLEARCDTLSLEYNELSEKVTILEEDSEGLKGQCEELAESVERLESLEGNKLATELKEQYEELSASHSELLERFEILEDDNETLKTRYNNLSIGHNELLERHNTLSANYNELDRKYDELLEEVETLGVFATGELMTKYNDLSLKYESLSERIKELEKNSGGDITNIPCTSIFLNKTDISFYSVGETETLIPTVFPADCTDNITWESNKPSIARVNNGLVTALSNGSCIIIATCGNYSASCYVNVNIQTSTVNMYTITNDLTNVTNNNIIDSIEENENYYTMLTYEDNYELSLIEILMNNIDITDSVCSKQSDYCIVNIPNVTGNVVITAKATITTSEPITHNIAYTIPTGVTIDNKPATIENNNSFTAIIEEQEGYEISSITVTMGGIDITNDVVSDYNEGGTTPNHNITYALSNGVTIDNNPSTVENNNSFTAIIEEQEGYTIDSIEVTMGGIDITNDVVSDIEVEEPKNIPCTNITLNETSLNFTNLSSQTLTATLTPSNTTDTLVWSSSENTIASVSNTGIVTPISNGNCTITATCGSKSAICNITVNIQTSDGNTNTLTLEPSNITLTQISETSNLVLRYNNEIISNYLAGWTSSNDAVVYVDSMGTVMALTDGDAVITASYNGLLATCSINVNINNRGNTDSNTVYTNPTITYDSTMYKAKLTQDGYTEYIDLSYKVNTGHADYSSNITVSDGSQTHYLALLKADSTSAISKFRVNGLIPDIGGWFTRTGGYDDDNLYNLWLDPRMYYGTNFEATIKNNGVTSDCFNKSLNIFNSMFPALNLSSDSSSGNEIVMCSTCELGDDYLGMTWAGNGYESGFYIEIYSSALTQYGGSYSSNPNYWISTVVHELGHTLGLDDDPIHSPTIYNYDENHSKCWYQQSNDVYAFKTLAKEQFGLDVITALEDSSGVRYNIESTVIGDTNTSSQGGVRCSYVVHENPEEKSDIVVNAKLVFVEEEEYLPSNGGRGIMYFDVYEIEPLDIIKGEDLLEKNNKVKIPKYSGINVDTNNNYKLCLRKREGAHVLLNPSQGIGVIK